MDKYAFRQWYIMLCIIFYQVSSGINTALPGVITPIITDNITDTTDIEIHATREQASWFVASFGATGLIAFVVTPALTQNYGRRFTFIFMSLIHLIGSLIMALATDVTMLTVGRAFTGLDITRLFLCGIILSEYSHPKRRGVFVVLMETSTGIGHILCHGFGLKMTWRHLTWFSIAPLVLAILGATKWPESPSWYAYKGRYEDCAKSFEYMRGIDQESTNELKKLVTAQQVLQKTTSDYGTSVLEILKAFRSKVFLKSLLISILLLFLTEASGGFYILSYLVEIMTKLTGDRSKALYFSIGSDVSEMGLNLLIYWLIKKVKRRIAFFSLNYISFVILSLTCTLSYLDAKGILHTIWLKSIFLIIYIGLRRCCLTVMIIIKSEIYPLKYRGLVNMMTGVVMSVTSFLVLKLTSNMLKLFDVHGTFSIYLAICLVPLLSLYFVLPETKDRTLQDIENDFTGLKIEDIYNDKDVENDFTDLKLRLTGLSNEEKFNVPSRILN